MATSAFSDENTHFEFVDVASRTRGIYLLLSCIEMEAARNRKRLAFSLFQWVFLSLVVLVFFASVMYYIDVFIGIFYAFIFNLGYLAYLCHGSFLSWHRPGLPISCVVQVDGLLRFAK